MSNLPTPWCMGCNTPAKLIEEYIEAAEDANMDVEEYIRDQEGTYNPENGHLLCTDCYIAAGMPSLPHPQRWIAP